MTRRVHFGAGATTTIREYQIERIPGFDSPKMKKLDSRKKKNAVTIQFEQGEHEIQNLSCMTTVNDVIYAMIKTGNQSLQSFHPSQLVIVESWRKQERPLPPRTRLLKVWKSWGVEQANVKYYLKEAQSIPFRQSKSWRHSFRQRRTSRKVQKPSVESSVEIQIDGPWSVHDKITSSSASSSASSISLSEGSTTSSSTSSSSFGEASESAERQALLHHCMEREKYLHSMRINETKLNNQLAGFVSPPTPPPPTPEVCELMDEIEWTKTRISALEEQISAINNTYAGLKDRYDEVEKSEPIESAQNILIMFRAYEQMDKLRINIEAQLYLNLSLTAEMQRFETHISDLDRSIDARRALVQSQFENFPISDEEEPDHHFETSSQFSDHTECHTCPDCRMGTPIHLKTRQMSDFDVLVKSCSKTSLTDSAISSMSSCLTKDSISSPPKITDL